MGEGIRWRKYRVECREKKERKKREKGKRERKRESKEKEKGRERKEDRQLRPLPTFRRSEFVGPRVKVVYSTRATLHFLLWFISTLRAVWSDFYKAALF